MKRKQIIIAIFAASFMSSSGFAQSSDKTSMHSPKSYEVVSSVGDSLFVVRQGERYGIVDRQMQPILPLEYSSIALSEDVFIIRKNGLAGIADIRGTIILSPTFAEIDGFTESGLSACKQAEKHGYIDKRGNVVIPFKYDSATPFVEGQATVELKGETFNKILVIDERGRVIKSEKICNGRESDAERAASEYWSSKGYMCGQTTVTEVNPCTWKAETIISNISMTRVFLGVATIKLTEDGYKVINPQKRGF
ncbi:MAG: WG repeat-containing protein [Chloroherpetonaceae bacterium]|nr:WG repeat-containing protein [Chloroherpetonaceae bacterium]